MAVSSAISGLVVRYHSRSEQPSYNVEDDIIDGIYEIPPYQSTHKPGFLVHIHYSNGDCDLYILSETHLLLGSRAPRVPPPDSRELLLRAVDRAPVSGDGDSAVDYANPAQIDLVHPHGSDLLPRA